MFSKILLFVGIIFILVACSESEQSKAKPGTPSMEEAREIAAAVEREYYADKPRPVNEISPKRDENVLDKKHFQILSFSLGYSLFDDVQKKLGKASVITGKEDHYGSTICYISSGANDKTLVEFWSWYRTLDAIKIYADKNQYEYNQICAESDLISSEIATLSGLRLLLSQSESEALIKVPHYESSNDGAFKYWGGYEEDIDNHPHYKKLFYNQDINLTFKGGKLIFAHLEVVGEPLGDVWLK